MTKSTVMYATRFPNHTDGTHLSGFAHSEQIAKLNFYKPVERVTVRDLREGETSEYWAWWDTRAKRFDYVFMGRSLADMCFPYGSKVETEKGNGEIVNVAIDCEGPR